MRKGDQLDGSSWIAFFNGTTERQVEKLDAVELIMDKMVADVIDASPPLSIKRRRAYRRYQDKKQRGLIFSAAIEARRIGVSGQSLNAIVYLLG